MATYRIEPARDTLHGSFSREYPPLLCGFSGPCKGNHAKKGETGSSCTYTSSFAWSLCSGWTCFAEEHHPARGDL